MFGVVSLQIFVIITIAVLNDASIYNCPAPRSPENGLSFIFEDGRVVRYRCVPGFLLFGKAESNCVENQWNFPAPECRDDSDHVDLSPIKPPANQKEGKDDRTLFAWNDDETIDTYGSVPRRLPLINGLWSPGSGGKVISLASSNNSDKNGSTKAFTIAAGAGNDLLQQELSIAEIRHKQQQDVRRLQPDAQLRTNQLTWRQKQIQRAYNQPNILYQSGSRSASAYRGTPEVSNSIPILEPLPTPIRPTPPVPSASRRLNDPDLVEMRRNQIEQTLRERMNAIHPSASSHNADKAGLVEDARRRQYERVHTLRRQRKNRENRRAAVTESKKPEGTTQPVLAPPGVLFAIGEPPRRKPQFRMTSTTPQPESERVRPVTTSRPTLRPPPIVSRSHEKAGETQASLYQQYLQAQHLKNIMDYEIAAMNAETRSRGSRRSMSMTQSGQAERATGDVFSNVDVEWLRSLSPDLQERYLREVLMSRNKETRESELADQFLKRHLESEGFETFPSQISRPSSSGQVTIIQSQAAPPNISVTIVENWKNFDTSCNKMQNGQRLFIRAPKVKNAVVHRYERRKNPLEPSNTFLVAEYRCRKGYRLVEPGYATLFCQKMEWIGILPRCLAGSG